MNSETDSRPSHPILQKLAGTDRRSTGQADEVATEIAGEPALFAIVFDGMLHTDAVIRMRAADAVEKASRERPDLLQAYKERLIHEVAAVEQQEVRWHLVQMLPRLTLDVAEQAQVVALLEGSLEDGSQIVRANALQALAELAMANVDLRPAVHRQLQRAVETGSPAVRARARKWLQHLSG